MSAHASMFSVATPVWRLLWSRRVALPAFGITAMAGFLGWVGAMIRFSRVTPAAGDPMFAPLVAASALVMLPAAVGLLAGDAIQQLARRAALRLLPGLRERLLIGLGVVGVLTGLPLALGAAPFRAELSPLTACGPAAVGFALGALFPGRARSGLAWVAAFALPLLADPLCTLAGRPLVALGMVVGAAAAVAFSIGRLLQPGALRDGAVTWLQPFAGTRTRRDAERAARVGDARACPPARIVDRRDWFAAHRFEHTSGIGSILRPSGTVRFILVCFTVSMITPVVDSLGAGFQSLLAALVEAHVGPLDPGSGLGDTASSTVVVVLWVCTAVVAAAAGAPLLGELLYPISRRERAALSATIARRASLLVFVALLAVGGVFGVVSLELVGGAWPHTLPTFAWVAFVGLATAPWMQVLWLALGRRARNLADWRAWAVLLLGIALPVVLVSVLWDLWADEGSRLVTTPWVLGYVLVLAAGWAAQGPLLRRHFSRCDLAG